MFWPPKNVTVFHSKLLLDNCKFHIIKDEKLLSKMEGKTNFSRRLKQLDGLTDWPSPPIIYDKSTPVLKGPPPQNYQKLCLPIINRNPNPNPYWSFFCDGRPLRRRAARQATPRMLHSPSHAGRRWTYRGTPNKTDSNGASYCTLYCTVFWRLADRVCV